MPSIVTFRSLRGMLTFRTFALIVPLASQGLQHSVIIRRHRLRPTRSGECRAGNNHCKSCFSFPLLNPLNTWSPTKSAKYVTLSAFVHKPTFPGSLNV